MPKRENKKQQNKFKLDIPIVLMTVGIFFVSISALHWYFKWRALSMSKSLLAEYSIDGLLNLAAKPKRIFIEGLVDISITEQILIDDNWTISETEASHLANSASPGEKGNIIIYGHNKHQIMGNIRKLKGQEIISITSEDGIEHRYKISKMTEVDPDQTEFLKPTLEETLTLYTCSGFMDKKRFIVQAKPVL